MPLTLKTHNKPINSLWIIVIIAILLVISQNAYQPLEIDQPVTLKYQYNAYYLTYQVSRGTPVDVLFCFVGTHETQEPTQSRDGRNYTKCNIVRDGLEYFCINLQSSTGVFQVNYSYILLDPWSIHTADENIRRTASSYENNMTSENSEQKQVSAAQSGSGFVLQQTNTNQSINVNMQSYSNYQSVKISGYFQNKSFYHMYTCPQYNSQSGLCIQLWKQNYVHTYLHPEKRVNLIVQRLHYCGIFSHYDQQIHNHVFYGGTLRDDQYHMFFAVLTYANNDSQSLNMWGGISYSYDHANRDMFCFVIDGTSFDAASLIAGPVYKDIASNINGKEDTEIVDNTFSDRYRNYYMYFIQYNRAYHTHDRLGDESLHRKIYDEFAFAAYFQYVEGKELEYIKTPSCLQNKQHNFLFGFPADVSVSEKLLFGLFQIFFIGMLLIIF